MWRTSASSSLSPDESPRTAATRCPADAALRTPPPGKNLFRGGGKFESSEEDEDGDAEDAREEWCRMVETRPVFTL